MSEANTETTEEVVDESTTEESSNQSADTENVSDAGSETTEDSSSESESTEEASEGAPDEYEAISVPEGIQVTDEMLNELHDFGQMNNLSQEQLQGAVDLHLKVLEDFTTRQQEAWDQVKQGWEDQVMSDKSLQNESGEVGEALSTAKKAVLAIGGDDLMEVLDNTGAGSHPSVVKAFYELGQRLESGSLNLAGSGASSEKSAAELLYPSMANK